MRARADAIHRARYGNRETVSGAYFQKLQSSYGVANCPRHAISLRQAYGRQDRTAFWLVKIVGNKVRDRRVNRALRKRGWTVVRVWEHELAKRNAPKLLRRLTSTCQPSCQP